MTFAEFNALIGVDEKYVLVEGFFVAGKGKPAIGDKAICSGLRSWGGLQERFGTSDAVVQFPVVLFGHKVPCQIRTLTAGNIAVASFQTALNSLSVILLNMASSLFRLRMGRSLSIVPYHTALLRARKRPETTGENGGTVPLIDA